MGRYAFFSTGYEYKFRFAVQNSSDIRTFGGIMIGGPDAHEWEERDLEYIIAELKELSEGYEFAWPDIEAYPKTVKGTYELREAIDDKWPGHSEEAHCRYLLGFLIYHMLSYAKMPLTVDYEE
jgi:hypothetical protein